MPANGGNQRKRHNGRITHWMPSSQVTNSVVTTIPFALAIWTHFMWIEGEPKVVQNS